MRKVSSGDVAKNFGRFQDAALAEPVLVEKYGRASVVILSAGEYERLKKRDRQALAVEELSQQDIADLEKSEMDPRHSPLDSLIE